jgi:hypothetical protein
MGFVNHKTNWRDFVPRKTLAEKGMQTSLRLPSELYDKLENARRASGRLLGEEIRQRLEASLLPGANDPKARSAIEAIGWIFKAYRADGGGTWHEDPRVFRSVKAGIEKVLDAYAPEGADAVDERDINPFLGSLALKHARGEL